MAFTFLLGSFVIILSISDLLVGVINMLFGLLGIFAMYCVKVLWGLVILLAYLLPTLEKCFANSSAINFES